MVRPFEQQTGISVQYTGTRDLNGLVVAGRGPEESARRCRSSRPRPDGRVRPIWRPAGPERRRSTCLQYKNDTVPTFIDLGTVDGKLVGVFIKATLKGLIWYNPKVYTLDAPATWADA